MSSSNTGTDGERTQKLINRKEDRETNGYRFYTICIVCYSKLCFVEIPPLIDIYAENRRELMHYLSLGIRKMLKKCNGLVLSDDQRICADFKCVEGNKNASKYIKRTVSHFSIYF